MKAEIPTLEMYPFPPSYDRSDLTVGQILYRAELRSGPLTALGGGVLRPSQPPELEFKAVAVKVTYELVKDRP